MRRQWDSYTAQSISRECKGLTMGISQTGKLTTPESPETRVPARKAYIADYLGIIPYETALKMQQSLMQARAEGRIPDSVMLLQHPPVFTIGRFRGEADIIVPPGVLTQEGIDIFHTNRGGSITYHGPGQLVGYPILNIKENGLGVRRYIWKLEKVIINLLLALGIQGQRVAQYPGGVWVEEEKVCSIGIRVNRYVTMHGFALNVNTNLQHFEYINPCGIKGNVMTSISEILGKLIEPEDILELFFDSFSETFGLKHERGLEKCLNMLGVPSG